MSITVLCNVLWKVTWDKMLSTTVSSMTWLLSRICLFLRRITWPLSYKVLEQYYIAVQLKCWRVSMGCLQSYFHEYSCQWIPFRHICVGHNSDDQPCLSLLGWNCNSPPNDHTKGPGLKRKAKCSLSIWLLQLNSFLLPNAQQNNPECSMSCILMSARWSLVVAACGV